MNNRLFWISAIGAMGLAACQTPDQCFSHTDCDPCHFCNNGTCVRDSESCGDGLDNDCDGKIDEGCIDPCEGMVCNEPPPPSCVDGSTLRSYDPTGTCAEGTCTYAYQDIGCSQGCDTTSSTCQGCVNECQLAASDCAFGQVRTCQVSTEGCLTWGTPIDCPEGFCADTSTCGTCSHACTNGATECTSGEIRACVEDENGCRMWSTAAPCPSGHCQDSETCVVCNNTCSGEGQTDCQDGSLRVCESDGYGCLAWSAFASCPTGECEDTTACAGCAHGCDEAGTTECTSGELRTCITDDHGCRDWSDATACASGTCADATSCATDPCLTDTTCSGQWRLCENQGGMAVCGDCVPGFHDESGTCVADTSITRQFRETRFDLKDVDFVSDTVGWAVGAPHWDAALKRFRSTIIKTIDGGQSWTVHDTPEIVSLRGVCFVDSSNGWAVGYSGTVFRTSNGGDTWIPLFVPTNEELRAVVFVDASHGWVTGIVPTHYDFTDQPDDWRGSIWYTENGGETWTEQTLPDNASILNRLTFVDAQTGFVAGIQTVGFEGPWPVHEAVVYRTEDGGSSWVASQPPEKSIVLTGIDFVDADHGWVVGFKMNSGVTGGTIFATDDGGVTWQAQTPDYVLWDVEFSDVSHGYAVGTMYGAAWGPPVLRTQDGGATWETVHMEQHDGEGLYGVALLSAGVVTVGDNDFVARSTDPWGTYGFPNGENLFGQTYLNHHYRWEDVFFANANDGWVVGTRSYAPGAWGQVMMVTGDGGASWSVQYDSPPDIGFKHRLDSVQFVDAENGWVVGGSDQKQGAILVTDDGGSTWEQQGSELFSSWELEFFAVYALDSQHVWALAADHFPEQNIYLARTTNGGSLWEWVDTGVAGPMSIGYALVQGDLVFVDEQNGWAVGGQSKVLYTADGGDTWTPQALPSEYLRVFAVEFSDALHGWVTGEGLFRTSDGGTTWTSQAIDVPGDIHDITFVDADHGYLVGDSGAIRYTQDGGDTWLEPMSSASASSGWSDALLSQTLLGISMLDATQGWSVGEAGAIYRMEFYAP